MERKPEKGKKYVSTFGSAAPLLLCTADGFTEGCAYKAFSAVIIDPMGKYYYKAGDYSTTWNFDVFKEYEDDNSLVGVKELAKSYIAGVDHVSDEKPELFAHLMNREMMKKLQSELEHYFSMTHDVYMRRHKPFLYHDKRIQEVHSYHTGEYMLGYEVHKLANGRPGKTHCESINNTCLLGERQIAESVFLFIDIYEVVRDDDREQYLVPSFNLVARRTHLASSNYSKTIPK